MGNTLIPGTKVVKCCDELYKIVLNNDEYQIEYDWVMRELRMVSNYGLVTIIHYCPFCGTTIDTIEVVEIKLETIIEPKKFEINDKVNSVEFGRGIITNIRDRDLYPIIVLFNNEVQTYTLEGRRILGEEISIILRKENKKYGIKRTINTERSNYLS